MVSFATALPGGSKSARCTAILAKNTAFIIFVISGGALLFKNVKILEKKENTFRRSRGSFQKSCLTSYELLELSLKLLSVPRASTSAVIMCSWIPKNLLRSFSAASKPICSFYNDFICLGDSVA
ncbi:hypothetical protein SADUNF_Sadunf19G0106500 [Salix dunnii]|uniref:Uncharacterized protein n=1 Tax=Salix dunnii TaxID=1413687 RepID=A0A835J2A9_9ROSI|nr:hypothetical protein SADUNF_Sadunf19G0106500 [Salix dunnii]